MMHEENDYINIRKEVAHVTYLPPFDTKVLGAPS